MIFDELYGIPTTERVYGYTITFELGGTSYTYTTLDEQKNVIPLARGEKTTPSNVIACYSGEDLRLWNMAYEGYYMQYFKSAIRDRSFSPMIMYINKYCWKIAFIALLCSCNNNGKVRNFLHEILSINDIRDVEIVIETDEAKRESFSAHAAYRWYNKLKSYQDENANHRINANQIATTDMMAYGASQQENPRYVFQFLYLLSMPQRDERKGQTIDKLITDIKIYINGLNFDALSEGEKKMILIACITQILGDANSLVLLDEPDAHVHIGNKKKILDTIAQYNGQTILTTHSPIFTNLMTNGNIFPIEGGQLMSKEKQDLIASISGNEIDIINGACVVNSKYIIITEGGTDIRYIQQAIKALRTSNPRLDQFDKVAFLPQGSADHTESFYNDIVSKLPNTVVSILYLFDHDQAGQINSQKIQAKPKVQYLFYQPIYNAPYTSTYYIEDFFPESIYGKQLNIANIPQPISPNMHYHQIKEIVRAIQDQKKIADTIKQNIEQSSKRFNANHYTNFLPLLLEILNKFGL